MVRLSVGSITSSPPHTLTFDTKQPPTDTLAANDTETFYDVTTFKNRTRISEIHIVPTVNTQFIFKIYESDGHALIGLVYEVETTATGDVVHDIIGGEGLKYSDKDETSELHIGITNKSAGVASAFDIKIKHVSEV